MAELLLELFSEEIPARMQPGAAEDLRNLVSEGLRAAQLPFDALKTFVTPRRICLTASGIPVTQPPSREERKGPRVGSQDAAVNGFLKSTGLRLDQLEVREAGKAEFYFAVIEREGRPSSEVIVEIIEKTVREFPWPKSMRWGSGSLRWVRPLHSILCCFDGAPLHLRIDGVEAGDATRGHRFMAPDIIRVRNFSEYETALEKAQVCLDPEKRKARIMEQAGSLAEKHGLELLEDDALLSEVAGLNEWPVVLLGSFDAAFLDVPPEVLRTAMRTHQKYFSLRDAKTGGFAPSFIMVANMMAADGGAQIIAGNQRVLAARLSDAKFFWDQDRKHRLDSRLEGLKDMTFHERLGSVHDKVMRNKALAVALVNYLPRSGAEAVTERLVQATERAALLAKCDLLTQTVGEFPELQGVMGRYYALEDGETPEIAMAIEEHYWHAGLFGVKVPSTPVSVAVALADKIDTLMQFWRIGEKPTGSKDPYALRRAALGVIHLVLANHFRLPLSPLFQQHLPPEQADDLLSFFADRLKVHLRGAISHDLVDAVFALGGQDDLLLLEKRATALHDFVQSADGKNLLAAYRRAVNILRIEEKRDGVSYDAEVNPALLQQQEERALMQRLAEVEQEAAAALENEDFTAAMAAMARLRAPVDAFFEKVTVNAEEAKLRVNRLLLLSRIRRTMDRIADFSKIEA